MHLMHYSLVKQQIFRYLIRINVSVFKGYRAYKPHEYLYTVQGDGEMAQPFYKSAKWKRKREVILRRDEYLCRESKRYGKTEPATTVHHIYPFELFPELALVEWNLLSLSAQRHNAMHDRDTHEITELGKAWQDRFLETLEYLGCEAPC